MIARRNWHFLTQEETDLLLGRLFGYLAVIRAGKLKDVEDEGEKDNPFVRRLCSNLLQIMKKKEFLAQASVCALRDVFAALPPARRAASVQFVTGRLDLADPKQPMTADKLALRIVLSDQGDGELRDRILSAEGIGAYTEALYVSDFVSLFFLRKIFSPRTIFRTPMCMWSGICCLTRCSLLLPPPRRNPPPELWTSSKFCGRLWIVIICFFGGGLGMYVHFSFCLC